MPKMGPRIAQQGLARVGQYHAAGRALEELGADFGLQGLDLAGEGGLGQVQALGGATQVAFFRYGYEIGEAAEVHGEFVQQDVAAF